MTTREQQHVDSIVQAPIEELLHFKPANYHGDNTDHGARRNLTDRVPITVDGTTLHYRDEVDHLDALHLLIGNAALAGHHIPVVAWTEDDGSIHYVYTNEDLKAILTAVSERENRVAGAAALHKAKMAQQLHTARDTSLSVEVRYAALERFWDLRANFLAGVKAELANFDPHALPTDVETLRKVYVERIEAAATAKVKQLKGVRTQQGVDLPAACIDEQRAMEEVARQVTLASIEMTDADTQVKAKAVYDAALKDIRAVTAINTPVWEIGGQAYPANPPAPLALALDTITVKAQHPTGQSIDGKVAFGAITGRDEDGNRVALTHALHARGPGETHVARTIGLPRTVTAGKKVTLGIQSRNLCGWSLIQVVLTKQ